MRVQSFIRTKLVCKFICKNSLIFKTLFRNRVIFPLQAREIPGVQIFRFDGALYFASFEYFRTKLYQKTGLNPIAIGKYQKKEAKTLEKAMKVKERLAADNLGFQGEEVISRNSNQVISFDNNDNFSDIGQNSGTKPSSFNMQFLKLQVQPGF